VCLVDPAPGAPWRNNYGVWVDEFEALGYGECFTRQWPTARVVLDDSGPGIALQRAYAQVDRGKLKRKLLGGAAAAGVHFCRSKVDGTQPAADGLNAVQLRARPGEAMYCKAVVDATGHARRLVQFDSEFTPGYQAAYGILAEVEGHPFDTGEMLFMDWRDSHLDEPSKARNASLPTFLYVMPFSPGRIFCEETSLVARPGVDFDDIKLRMKQRLQRLGIVVTSVLEEEHCLIPMGGVLPRLTQRVIGIGGTAGMVHPSTGFQLSKTLASAAVLADSLKHSLLVRRLSGDAVSQAAWDAMWPQEQRRMRTFMCFGMETLMQLDLNGTRRFFGTFFGLPTALWSGFLSWRVRPVGLLGLGLSLFTGFDLAMRFEFILAALPFIPSFAANFFAPVAGNTFQSRPWGGLALPQMRRPDPPAQATNALVAGHLGGSLQILPPNPAGVPILSSTTDFPTQLIGLSQQALAGGLAAELASSEGDIAAPVDYAALLGRPLDVPLPLSACTDDRQYSTLQQRKRMDDQPALSSLLPGPGTGDTSHSCDVAVVGAGPSGLILAAELAQRGLQVLLIAPDTPLVNNYGVWVDEFEALGLRGTLAAEYTDALYWVDEASPNEGLPIGRAYGRVDRAKLRAELVRRCAATGRVRYLEGLVSSISHTSAESSSLAVEAAGGQAHCGVTCRQVVCCSGHNRELLAYERCEEGAPPMGWQTALGIECDMRDHPFPLDKVVFMDFRQTDPEGDEQLPTDAWRVPSFLYVMPTDRNTVFLQETCLMSKVQVPFDELQRRLYRRMSRMGLALDSVLETEHSWIPLGGPLPTHPQRTLAFGAAAGLVHPASGFSVANSMARAPELAGSIAAGLAARSPSADVAAAAWEVLWSPERVRRMGFHQFGMELLLSLRITDLRRFFSTFYALPPSLAHGFLSHRLDASQLLLFAFAFFVAGDWRLRYLLVAHLASPAGSGQRLAAAYLYTQPAGGPLADATVERSKPPQLPASEVSAHEQASQEAATSLLAGFARADWWVVGDGSK
jgi:lycopene cyclase-like protein